jgi:hypothetical protein
MVVDDPEQELHPSNPPFLRNHFDCRQPSPVAGITVSYQAPASQLNLSELNTTKWISSAMTIPIKVPRMTETRNSIGRPDICLYPFIQNVEPA